MSKERVTAAARARAIVRRQYQERPPVGGWPEDILFVEIRDAILAAEKAENEACATAIRARQFQP